MAKNETTAAAELQRGLAEHGITRKVSELESLSATQRAAIREWVEDGAWESKCPEFARDWTRNGKKTPTSQDNATAAAGEPVQGALGDWQDVYPEPVQKAAEIYDKKHKAKAKAAGEFNTARVNLIEAMHEHDCRRVRIRNGDKFITLETTDTVKIEKPTSNDPHPDVAAGMNRPIGTPALEATAKARKESGGKGTASKGSTIAPADPHADTKDRQCVKCNHIRHVDDPKTSDKCPECGTTAYTVPDVESKK